MATEPRCPQKSPIVQNVEPGEYWWCTCGRSQTQPFCDGSHRGTDFEPLLVVIEEARRIAWCACKHTKNEPFCDGTHAKL
ncbi:MAG TPA: CDGSH iron-sulfur domain-containing protein [Planctomycetota bacterium]|nr:CDGSH iron-sulfur domain-containing protein [Planctomycetota bacterium]